MKFLLSLGSIFIAGCTLTPANIDAIASGFAGLAQFDQYAHGLGVPFNVDKVYWVHHASASLASGIWRANLDGSGKIALLRGGFDSLHFTPTTMPAPHGIALDLVNGRIYWTDIVAGTIQTSDLNGKNVQQLLPRTATDPRLAGPSSIAINLDQGKMYWTEREGGTIKRADFQDGTNQEIIVRDLKAPSAIFLDLRRNISGAPQMYWAERDGDSVTRADLDGQNRANLVGPHQGFSGPVGIALDFGAGQMYVAANLIYRFNLDGTGETVIVGAFSVSTPAAIALDLQSKGLYFSDAGTRNILVGNLDGTGFQGPEAFLIQNTIGDPGGIALGVAR